MDYAFDAIPQNQWEAKASMKSNKHCEIISKSFMRNRKRTEKGKTKMSDKPTSGHPTTLSKRPLALTRSFVVCPAISSTCPHTRGRHNLVTTTKGGKSVISNLVVGTRNVECAALSVLVLFTVAGLSGLRHLHHVHYAVVIFRGVIA